MLSSVCRVEEISIEPRFWLNVRDPGGPVFVEKLIVRWYVGSVKK
jgi:hypothetical protein